MAITTLLKQLKEFIVSAAKGQEERQREFEDAISLLASELDEGVELVDAFLSRTLHIDAEDEPHRRIEHLQNAREKLMRYTTASSPFARAFVALDAALGVGLPVCAPRYP